MRKQLASILLLGDPNGAIGVIAKHDPSGLLLQQALHGHNLLNVQPQSDAVLELQELLVVLLGGVRQLQGVTDSLLQQGLLVDVYQLHLQTGCLQAPLVKFEAELAYIQLQESRKLVLAAQQKRPYAHVQIVHTQVHTRNPGS